MRRWIYPLILCACVPVPPGLPKESNDPVYIDSGAPPALDERMKLRAEAEKLYNATVFDAGPVEQPADGRDPLHGQWSMDDATLNLPGTGTLNAKIETSQGTIDCKLFEEKAPITVANFIGLANGLRPFKSHLDGRWVRAPYYDGTTFHRVIRGFMIQGGDPNGNGTGEPGYVIPDEVWPTAKHDKAGLLCMANRGKDTNGAQFFITDSPTPKLDGGYTIFGVCAPTSIVHAIAESPKDPNTNKPLTAVVIDRIRVTRDRN
jgi:peptidyl-prolyl cis-trans isomerase A (cyclophilin A)